VVLQAAALGGHRLAVGAHRALHRVQTL
jgi:hypothetical protein